MPPTIKEMNEKIATMIDKVVKDFMIIWPRDPQDIYLFYTPATSTQWGELHLIPGYMEHRTDKRKKLLAQGKKTYPVFIDPLSPADPPHVLTYKIDRALRTLPIVPWSSNVRRQAKNLDK